MTQEQLPLLSIAGPRIPFVSSLRSDGSTDKQVNINQHYQLTPQYHKNNNYDQDY